MNILVWNSQGARNKKFLLTIRDIVKLHALDVLVVLEPQISGDKAAKVIAKLEFNYSIRIDAQDFLGGTWFLWKVYSLRADFLCSTPKFLTSN